MDTLGQEISQGARRLLRSPAFTCASVLTLALAIGANGAIFGVVERVVINPLPYPASDRLIELDHGVLGLKVANGIGLTSGMYFHYLNRARTLESAALYLSADQTITGGGEPERIRVSRVTPSLATVLQVTPAVGRWFTRAEGEPGAPDVAILSHRLWTRRYGRNPNVVGQTFALDGRPMEVVGIMPARFAFPDSRVDVWTAAQLTVATGFGLFEHTGVARLRDGVNYDMARAEVQSLIASLTDAYPNDPRAKGNVEAKLVFTGRTLKDATLGNVTQALWILLAAVGVVLLVACANVANLFLVRSEVRQREVAIRRALGAGRAGMTRYFLIESVLLASAGGALGSLLSWGALRLLVRAGPATLPRLHEIRWDPLVLAYIAALSLVAAVVFGAMPLWRRDIASVRALHESGRGNTATRQRHYTRHVLLGAQVALALVLLVASGLMVRSFQKLRAIDPGFNPSSTLTFSVGLPDREYRTLETVVAAHHAIIEQLSALPGVTDVAATTCLPLSGRCTGNTLRVEGHVYSTSNMPPIALFGAVTGGYFETMGTRVLRGRTINRDDVDRKELVAVINSELAKRAFGDQDPIGKRVASNQPPVGAKPPQFAWLTVVGVVGNTPFRALNESPMPLLFMPLSLANGPDVPVSVRIAPMAATVSYVVRTATPPLDQLPAVRRAIQMYDRHLAVAQVMSLQDLLDRASAQMAFTMVLLAIAATVALLLGVIGIYGVMSYIVNQRTAEIGVRLALGANPGSVAGQIVRQGGVVALVGIAVGLAVAFAGSDLIASVLYGVGTRDPIVFGTMATMLFIVSLLACWLPARRAARLSPSTALRAE